MRKNKLILRRFLSVLSVVLLSVFYLPAEEPGLGDDGDGGFSNTGIIFPVPVPKNGSTRDVIVPSPKVASLGIFGQVPVGNYTGTATINIPLHTISYKELSVPVSISYNTIGNRPDIVPGNVGLGWGLQAGGMITRKINGHPDTGGEIECGLQKPSMPDHRDKTNWFNVLHHYGELIQGEEKTNYFDFKGDIDPDEFSYNINGQTGSFYLNYDGAFMVQSDQGNFFHVFMHQRNNNYYTLFPDGVPARYSPNAAEFDYWSFFGKKVQTFRCDSVYVCSYINGFTMIDSHGIKYTFGNGDGGKNNDNAIEFTRLGHNEFSWEQHFEHIDFLPHINAMTWHLTSIESPYGYKIEFLYEREHYVTKFSFTDAAISSNFTRANISPVFIPRNAMYDNAFRSTMINGSVLKEITYPDGKAVFSNSCSNQNQLSYDDFNCDPQSIAHSYNERQHKNQFYYYQDVGLANTGSIYGGPPYEGGGPFRNFPQKTDGISFYNQQDSLIRTVEFDYVEPDEFLILNRLKLYTILISGGSTGTSLKYSFEYIATALPSYLMNMTDYYGFYNGNKLFTEHDPPDNSFESINNWIKLFLMEEEENLGVSIPYLDYKKKPSFDYARAEILTKIVFPTGGYSLLEYEPHDFGKVYTTWPFGVREANDTLDIHKNDAGGVRIKSVNNYDNNNNLIKTTQYVYKDAAGKSSGVLAYKPTFLSKYYSCIGIRNIYYEKNTDGGGDEGDGEGTELPNSSTNLYLIDPYLIFDTDAMENLATTIEEYTINDQDSQGEYTAIKGVNCGGEESNNGFYRNGSVRYRGDLHRDFFRFSTNPVHPMGATRGNHVTYSEVKVIEGDSAGVNGYTVYKYKNFDNGYADIPLKGYVTNELRITNCDYDPTNPYCSVKFWENEEGISMKLERGQPISVEVFDNNDNKIKRSSFFYNDDPERFQENVRYYRCVTNDISLIGAINKMAIAGEHYTYHPWLKQKQDILYFGNDSIVTTVTNSYNEQYRLLKTTEMTDSRNDLLKNETFYPFEQATGVYKTMTDNFMLAYPTRTISTKNNEVIAEAQTEYATLSNLILPHKEFFSIGGKPLELISTINEYDIIGNPLSITDEKSGDKVCYLWSYNGNYPVAKIVGFDYDDVKYFVNENVINTLWEKQNPTQEEIETIRTTLTNAGALVTTYTYIPSIGICTETDFRGVTTYYKYDGLGRLTEIKAGKKQNPADDDTNNRKKIESYEYYYKK